MNDQVPHFRSLNESENSELDQFMAMGLEMIPVHPDIQQDGALVIAIHLVLDACRQGNDLPSGIDKKTLLLCLGVAAAVSGGSCCSAAVSFSRRERTVAGASEPASSSSGSRL